MRPHGWDKCGGNLKRVANFHQVEREFIADTALCERDILFDCEHRLFKPRYRSGPHVLRRNTIDLLKELTGELAKCGSVQTGLLHLHAPDEIVTFFAPLGRELP